MLPDRPALTALRLAAARLPRRPAAHGRAGQPGGVSLMRYVFLLLLLAGCAGVEPDDSGGAVVIGEQRAGFGPVGTIGGRDGVVMQADQWFPGTWFPGRR